MRTDRHDETNFAFRNFSNAPKNGCSKIQGQERNNKATGQ